MCEIGTLLFQEAEVVGGRITRKQEGAVMRDIRKAFSTVIDQVVTMADTTAEEMDQPFVEEEPLEVAAVQVGMIEHLVVMKTDTIENATEIIEILEITTMTVEITVVKAGVASVKEVDAVVEAGEVDTKNRHTVTHLKDMKVIFLLFFPNLYKI